MMQSDTHGKVNVTVPRSDGPVVVVEPEPVDPVRQTPLHREPQFELSKLPIDDDDYEPSYGGELGRALHQLFIDTPDKAVPWVWKKALTLNAQLVAAQDESDDMMTPTKREPEEVHTTSETIVRRMIRDVLTEASPRKKAGRVSAFDKIDDDDVGRRANVWGDADEQTAVLALSDADADMLASIRKQVDDDVDPADFVADEEEEAVRRAAKYNTAGEEGMTLADIAKELQMAGPSGVKNLLNRIEDKMKYFASLDEIWFKKLMDALALEYIDALEESIEDSGGIDPSDKEFLDDLREDPEQVHESETFRAWSKEFLTDIYKQKAGRPAKHR